jgi:glycosyltransferase involved in cell wall biosynthesis
MRGFHERRCEILVVSAMARHKAIEDVVDALVICRRNGIDVGMKLVGPWPDPAYEALVRERVRESGLSDHVEFIGYVSREQLHRCYGEARVFCLLSRCESFGIPAVEAEAFGTPAVVADCGAPPEVAGPGGVVVPPGSPLAAAEALAPLLTDPAEWECASLRARANAERFRWTTCTKPLLEWIIANERS